jgi:uncharacterized membrane protein
MVSTSAYLIVFRILHVVGAIAWGGAIFLLVFFLQPTAKELGPAAGPFMRELLENRRLTTVILWIATVAIVAGAFLYWHDMDAAGGVGDFVGTAFGLWITLGSVSALIAFAIGLFLTRPTLQRATAVGAQIAAAGDAPPPELVQELQRLQAWGRTLAKTNLTFLTLAALAMATARYW